MGKISNVVEVQGTETTTKRKPGRPAGSTRTAVMANHNAELAKIARRTVRENNKAIALLRKHV